MGLEQLQLESMLRVVGEASVSSSFARDLSQTQLRLRTPGKQQRC